MSIVDSRLVQVGVVEADTACLWVGDPAHFIGGGRPSVAAATEIARCAFLLADKPVQGNLPKRLRPGLGVALPLPRSGTYTVHEVRTPSGFLSGYFVAVA